MNSIRSVLFVTILAVLLLAGEAWYFLKVYTPKKIGITKLESIKSREQLEDEYKLLKSDIKEIEASMGKAETDRPSPDQTELMQSQKTEIARLTNELNSLNRRLQNCEANLVKFERKENSNYSITLIIEKDNLDALSQLQVLLQQKGFSVKTLTFDVVEDNAFIYYAASAKEKADYVAEIIGDQMNLQIQPEIKQKREWATRFQIKLKTN